MVREIPLTQGKVALVDDHDFEWLSAYRWHALHVNGHWYAIRRIREDGKQRAIYMHREIMGFPRGHTDHRDNDGLNNVRANLRAATASQNVANSGKPVTNTSGFKGVRYHGKSKRNPWLVQLCGHHVGLYPSAEEGARAYDRAAVERWGEFARTNQSLGLLSSQPDVSAN